MSYDQPFLLYGATGYTGELTARTAVDLQMRPILAGRNREKVARLAGELGLPWRAFGLDDAPGTGGALHSALRDVPVVLHCAGPFSQTYRPMVDACLHTGTHYLDITGEMVELEDLPGRDAEAKAAGVMLLPSAGFDVVPSDCLALHVARRLPSATRLALAFMGAGGFSRGTMRSVVDTAERPGMIRKDGKLTPVPAGYKSRDVDFGKGPVRCVTIPWGDVATAYYSTGIPNIETYAGFGAGAEVALKGANVLKPLLGSALGQRALKGLVGLLPAGPGAAERAKGYALLWAEVTDEAGNRAVSRMRTPHAYTLTALTALEVVRRVLAGDVHPGFQTPAKAYGPDLILEIGGVKREDL
ncbi:MAG: saccharopine dehydrogenase family protein [Nitrososphaerales archaeon]